MNSELELYNRTESFIEWLEVIARANCEHVTFENASFAEELIVKLKSENRERLEKLANKGGE